MLRAITNISPCVAHRCERSPGRSSSRLPFEALHPGHGATASLRDALNGRWARTSEVDGTAVVELCLRWGHLAWRWCCDLDVCPRIREEIDRLFRCYLHQRFAERA